MKSTVRWKTRALVTVVAIVIGAGAISPDQKYTLQVPGGIAFSEVKGYEGWQLVSVSESGGKIAAILGNPAMIEAYRAGIPENGKSFPNGAKIAKIHWIPKQNAAEPGGPLVPESHHDSHFMVRDDKRFADSGGWGYAAFQFDVATQTFRVATLADNPPQSNDAKCGAGCHMAAKARDYVFTSYQHR